MQRNNPSSFDKREITKLIGFLNSCQSFIDLVNYNMYGDEDKFTGIDTVDYADIKNGDGELIIETRMNTENYDTIRMFIFCYNGIMIVNGSQNQMTEQELREFWNVLGNTFDKFMQDYNENPKKYKNYRGSKFTKRNIFSSEEIASGITMDNAKSIVDRLTDGKSVSSIYCNTYAYNKYSKADLFSFADSVIDEVNKYVIEDRYYIEWRDIHFEDDFEFIVMNVIDSDNVSYNADIIIDIDKFIDNYNYRCRCINLLVDQITEAYSGEEH